MKLRNELNLTLPSAVQLSVEVTALANQLPSTFDDSTAAEYYDFIAECGTHYVSQGKFGGMVKQRTEVSEEYMSSRSIIDVQLEAKGVTEFPKT